MLNENKVKMMTKMAIYEKNEGRRMLKTARYFKSDYIAFGILKTLITTSIAYIIMLIMYVLYNMESIIKDINKIDYTEVGTNLIIGYVAMIAVFSAIAFVVYGKQYDNSRNGLKRYFSRLNKLERFYNGHKRKIISRITDNIIVETGVYISTWCNIIKVHK